MKRNEINQMNIKRKKYKKKPAKNLTETLATHMTNQKKL